MILLLTVILLAILWPDLVAAVIGWLLALAVYAALAIAVVGLFVRAFPI